MAFTKSKANPFGRALSSDKEVGWGMDEWARAEEEENGLTPEQLGHNANENCIDLDVDPMSEAVQRPTRDVSGERKPEARD